ncbi:HAD family phosphatase, partial [Vibrio cholerae]
MLCLSLVVVRCQPLRRALVFYLSYECMERRDYE